MPNFQILPKRSHLLYAGCPATRNKSINEYTTSTINTSIQQKKKPKQTFQDTTLP